MVDIDVKVITNYNYTPLLHPKHLTPITPPRILLHPVRLHRFPLLRLSLFPVPLFPRLFLECGAPLFLLRQFFIPGGSFD